MGGGFFGEGDHKDSKDVSVLRLDVRHAFDEGLSLLDQGADFVLGGVDSVERGDSLSSLSLVNNKFDFSPVEAVLVGSKVSLHLRYNSAANAVFDLF